MSRSKTDGTVISGGVPLFDLLEFTVARPAPTAVFRCIVPHVAFTQDVEAPTLSTDKIANLFARAYPLKLGSSGWRQQTMAEILKHTLPKTAGTIVQMQIRVNDEVQMAQVKRRAVPSLWEVT